MQIRKMLGAAVVAAFLLPFPALAADSPDNLDIVWARAAGDRTPIFSEPAADSKVLRTLRHNDLVHISGVKMVGGEAWYNVVRFETSDIDGWMRGRDTWFSPLHAQGFEPATHQLYDRLRMRLDKYIGNYPERTTEIFGKPFDGTFVPDHGATVTTLHWRGLTMQYSNSTRRKSGAWINYVFVTPGKVGKQVMFGPIRIGSSVEQVRALASKLGRNKEGKGDRFVDLSGKPDSDGVYELRLENAFQSDRYCFRFFISPEGKVVRMEHRYAYP